VGSERPGAEALGALCSETVALMHRFWGKGPTKCRASWAGPDALLIVLADGFTAAEQTVVEAGHERDVMAFRSIFHDVMNERMTEIVERLTARSVEAAMSASHAAPDLTALVFVFKHDQGA
jgi:uncharacterized protein YbcI